MYETQLAVLRTSVRPLAIVLWGESCTVPMMPYVLEHVPSKQSAVSNDRPPLTETVGILPSPVVTMVISEIVFGAVSTVGLSRSLSNIDFTCCRMQKWVCWYNHAYCK